jgi:hypothetical protein
VDRRECSEFKASIDIVRGTAADRSSQPNKRSSWLQGTNSTIETYHYCDRFKPETPALLQEHRDNIKALNGADDDNLPRP